MTLSRLLKSALAALALAVPVLSVQPQSARGTTFDEVVPSGANFDKAEVRLGLPNDVASLRGIVVLVPGSNGGGRAQAQDTVWQAFATQRSLALRSSCGECQRAVA